MKILAKPLRRLAVALAVAATLMTSIVAATPDAGRENADTFARTCVAHRSGICRETPFPINRMPLG